MGDCIVTPQAVSDFAAKNVNMLIGRIAAALVRKTPYMNILTGGTLPAGTSDVVRSVVQERAVVGTSLVEPVFADDTSMCNTAGNVDQVGSVEYSYRLQTYRGRGPKVCVKTSRNAFKGAYTQAEQALTKGIAQIMNSDIRALLVNRSGLKFVTKRGNTFETNLTGSESAVDTPFLTDLPDAAMTYKVLAKMASTLREDFLCDPYETDKGAMFMFIGGYDQVDAIRNELNVREDYRSATTGGYTMGKEALMSYEFQGPYRGWGFGIDSQPLRFNVLDGNGQPVFIEPEISVATTKGVAFRLNPAWRSANYEVGFAIAADSFERLVPEDYTGEGSFKFDPAIAPGKLQWHYQRDNDCNVFGDTGFHIYEISRAYRPVRPHAVVPIAYQRCSYDMGLAACAATSGTGL